MSKAIVLSAKDLNAQGGIFCPSPLAGMQIRDTHPRVFLNLAGHHATGQVKCPYCSTEYKLAQTEGGAGGGH